MKLGLLLGLCAVALARVPQSSWEQEHFPEQRQLDERYFKRGSEFQFEYNGQVATGIPGSSQQHAATRVQALVSLVLKGEQKAILQVRRVRMGTMNQNLYNPRAMVPFLAFQEVPLQQEAEKELQLPVMFSYQHGVVSDLVFDGAEKPWSANIKKGILNMLQVNLQKKNQIKITEEAQLLNRLPQQQQKEFDFFATQEKTVEGECETLYTIVSNPEPEQEQQVLNVTRSIEFENCKQRPEVKYNFRFQDPCETCEPKYQEDQKFLKSSSVAKFNISGTPEQFLIESATVESQYQVVPFNREGNVISTYVNQTLVLIKSGPVQNNLRQPKNPQASDSDLMYTLDWDKEMENFLMKGQDQARLPVDIKERVQILSDILRPLVSEMRECVSEQAPIEYARLIKLLRFTEKSQLPQIFQHFVHQQPEQFTREEHLKIKAVLTDALADAGTKDTISFLLDLIKEKKISPLRASLTIKQLINIRTPSKEIIREFLNFIQTPVVQKNFVLKQAAYLTLGSLVQGLCMPSEERLAILPRPSSDKLPKRLGPNTHLCPQQLQDQLLQKMFEMIEQEQSEEKFEEAILALKTIGNMGIPKSVMKLEKIISSEEREYPEIVRIEAIMALRQLREVLPQKIQQILMPVFMNREQSNEIRMSAVHMIFETQPSRPVLDQVARKLFAERSHQVASFVYTYMSTLANSTNPCEKKFARDLQLSLRHGRVIARAFLPQYSKYLHASAYSQKFRMGADLSLTSVISNRTFVPRYLGASLHTSALGFWSKYLVQVGVAQENLEKLFSRVLRRTDFDDLSLQDILERNTRGQQSPVKELKKLWKKLETVARQMPGSPKALAFLKIKDQEFFMLPISQKSIEKLPSLKEMKQLLQEGTHFNLHKAAQLHEVEYKIPTTVGMPIVVSVRIPSVYQLSGQVRVEMKNPFKVHFNNIKPSAAISVITTVNIWNPVAASGLKIQANAKVCTPVSGKVQVDLKKNQPSVRLSVEPEEKQVEWVKMETIPMTFTRVYRFPLTAYPKAQYKTIVGEQWNRVNNVRQFPIVKKTEQVIQKVLGMQVRMEGLWHHTPVNGPAFLPVCPFSGPNHFVIRSQPTEQLPKEFVLKMSAQMKKQQKIRSQQFEMEQEEINQEEFESNKGYETVIKTEVYTKGSQQERKAELETRVSFSPALRIVKSEMELTVQPIQNVLNRKIKVCSQGFVQYPQTPRSFSQLSGKAMVGQIKATWGQEQCKEQNKIEIRLAAKHSQQQQQEWEQKPEYSWYQQEQCDQEPERCSPVHLRQALNRPQELLKYNVQAHFNNISPVVKNATNGLFNAIKAYYYWNVNQINFNIENPQNQISAQVVIDSNTRQFFNLTVKTPVENVTFTDAELPVPVMMPISLRAIPEMERPSDIFEQLIRPVLPVCRINSRRVETYDDVEFRAPLSTCWTVLAKDCDDETNPAYAVLVKNIDEQSQQKALKIVTRKHSVVLEPETREYESLKVKVNGKQVREQNFPENEQVEVQKNGQQMKVILREAGIRVHFDGYSAEVQMSPIVASSQCGLCGHYDYDSQNEFRTPENQRVNDIRRFIQSYTIKDGNCQFPQQLSQIADSNEEMNYQPQWEQEERYSQSWEQSQEEQDEQEQDEQEQQQQNWSEETLEQFRPIRRTQTEEEGRKICFSTEQVRQCPRDSFPAQYEEEQQQVQFRCISRNHPEAHRFLRIARQQRQQPQDMQEQLDQAELAYTNEYSVPKLCRRDF